jgi:hypothetical protein
MSHLAGKCSCGRPIHFPRDAQLGYQWVCRRCGKTWVLSTQGEPLTRKKSLPPPAAPSARAAGGGCVVVLVSLSITLAALCASVALFLAAP